MSATSPPKMMTPKINRFSKFRLFFFFQNRKINTAVSEKNMYTLELFLDLASSLEQGVEQVGLHEVLVELRVHLAASIQGHPGHIAPSTDRAGPDLSIQVHHELEQQVEQVRQLHGLLVLSGFREELICHLTIMKKYSNLKSREQCQNILAQNQRVIILVKKVKTVSKINQTKRFVKTTTKSYKDECMFNQLGDQLLGLKQCKKISRPLMEDEVKGQRLTFSKDALESCKATRSGIPNLRNEVGGQREKLQISNRGDQRTGLMSQNVLVHFITRGFAVLK